MKISVISFSRAGAQKNLEVAALLREKNHQTASYSWHAFTGRKLIPFKSLELLLTDLWDSQEVLLVLTQMEHAVNAVVPVLQNKSKGPAIVVMDESGKFVVPLHAGRIKGLESWCSWFAMLVDAIPVVTAAETEEEIFQVDAFARHNQLHIQDIYRIRTIAECLDRGRPVGIYSDYPVEGVLPEGFVRVGAVMQNGSREDEKSDTEAVPEDGISITDDWEAPHFVRECRMFPRNVVLGLSCQLPADADKLEQFVRRTLAENHISRERVCAVFSEKKADCEEILTQLADRMDVPYFAYTAGQLPGPAGSLALCERCALLGSGNGKARIHCTVFEGMAVSAYEREIELRF